MPEGLQDTERLLRLADFLVVSRPGQSFSSLREHRFASISGEAIDAVESGRTQSAEGRLEGGRTLYLLRITDVGVSATMIRELAASGGSLRYLLPESVESFIMSHGLYRGE